MYVKPAALQPITTLTITIITVHYAKVFGDLLPGRSLAIKCSRAEPKHFHFLLNSVGFAVWKVSNFLRKLSALFIGANEL